MFEDIQNRAEKSHLVVATLIATVTFAAGFTLPGGTFQEGEHQGTPILKHNAAFQAFLVTDTIAMVLSTSAVLIHMLLALTPKQGTREGFLVVAFLMTVVAMASMMTAFLTGTFAMLGVSSGLGIAILVLGFSLGLGIVIIFIGLLFSPCILCFSWFIAFVTCQIHRS